MLWNLVFNLDFQGILHFYTSNKIYSMLLVIFQGIRFTIKFFLGKYAMDLGFKPRFSGDSQFVLGNNF